MKEENTTKNFYDTEGFSGFSNKNTNTGSAVLNVDKNLFNANSPSVPNVSVNVKTPVAQNANGVINGGQNTDQLKSLFGENPFDDANSRFIDRTSNFVSKNTNAVSMLGQQYRSLLDTVTASARQRMTSIGQPPEANATNASGDLFSGAFRNDTPMNGPQEKKISQPTAQTVAQMNGVTTETVGGRPSSSYMYGNTRIAIPDGIDINDDKAMGGFVAENNAIIDFMNRDNNEEEEV